MSRAAVEPDAHLLWLSKECAQHSGKLCSLKLWLVFQLQLPSHFQHSVCLTLKTSEHQVPGFSSCPVSLCVHRVYSHSWHVCSRPVLNPQGSREAEPEAVQQADASLPAHWPLVLLNPTPRELARKVQAVWEQNLTVPPSSSSFLGVLLAGSHWYMTFKG